MDSKGGIHKSPDRNWSLVICWLLFFAILFQSCVPKEEIVLRQIKDVVVDASSEPKLKADAIFYNPNKMKMKLKKIKVDIFVDGKKSGEVDQDLKTLIPAQGEFTVPLEVRLALKELGLLDTIFGMIGGKTFEVHYKGYLKLNYNGVPVRVPVDYKDKVKIRI
ncbi:MAG TPA: LEA type 2 family protein [Cyclobacteriaceae bacterium]|nr:LEA type 2 family protein [Cyclobacteriaceae bacterium]